MPTELIKDFIDKECKITFINEQFEVIGKIIGKFKRMPSLLMRGLFCFLKMQIKFRTSVLRTYIPCAIID